MTIRSVFSVAAIASLSTLFAACSAAPDDADLLAGEDAVAEVDDALVATKAFIVTRRDYRKCISPLCGGVYVKAVNQATTTCLDGVRRSECYVGALDYASVPGVDGVREALESGKGVLEGTLTPTANFATTATLKVSAAWRGASGATPNGTFYRVGPSGIVCITTPCPTLKTTKLNTTTTRTFSSLRLASTSPVASLADRNGAMTEASNGTGILVASTSSTTGSTVTASEFYRKVVAVSTVGRVCGGRGTQPCAEGEYCAFPATANCGRSDASGSCARKAEICTRQYQPVCGCDGVTYGNSCTASSAGVSVEYTGACR